MKRIYCFLIFSIMIVSCLTCIKTTKEINHDYIQSLNYAKNIISRKSFVQVEIKLKGERCFAKNICIPSIRGGTGSGFIIKKDRTNTYIFSAAHICEGSFVRNMKSIFSKEINVIDISHNKYKAKIDKVDSINDMCILKINKILPYKNINISSVPPSIGDRIYNISAPKSFFKPNLVPIFEGFYIGRAKEKNLLKDHYSIFSMTGSSGSMIINYKGKLIGIVTHYFYQMPICFGPSYSVLKNFLK